MSAMSPESVKRLCAAFEASPARDRYATTDVPYLFVAGWEAAHAEPKDSDEARAAWMWEGLRFLSACADAQKLDTKTEPFYLATNAFLIELHNAARMGLVKAEIEPLPIEQRKHIMEERV